MAEEIKDKDTGKKKKHYSGISVNPIDVIFTTLHHWIWIVISVAVCTGAAYLYLLRIPDTYTRAAEIQLKDGNQQNQGADELAALGIIKPNTNIQNEISNLKALDLMTEVVKRLGLDYDYYHKGVFHDEIAYGGDLPVKVKVDGIADDASLSFELTVSEGGKVTITDFVEGEHKEVNKPLTGRLNSAISSPAGNIIVSPTPSYVKGKKYQLLVNKRPLRAAAGSYKGRMMVYLANDNSAVVRLVLTDESPQRADEVLNMLINVYNEAWIKDRNQIAVSTSDFINGRLQVIENELGNVESEISSIKSATLTPDFNAAASTYAGQRQSSQDKMLELNNQLSLIRYVRSYIAAAENRNQLLPGNGMAGSGVDGLIGQYNEMMLQRNSLVNTSSEENPLVKQIDERLAIQRRTMLRTIDNEIATINIQMKSIQNTEAQATSKLASAPGQATKMLSIERQQKVKESLYLFLLQKREENELSQAFTAYNTRIVNKPGPAGMPVTPDRDRLLMTAFLVGLLLPFGVVYLKELLNTQIRGRGDIEDLSAPFLGEIPLFYGNVKKKRFRKDVHVNAIVVEPGKRDAVNEAFRVLRTNLEFVKIHKDEADVIALTSFSPGSGKSFLSMNLGLALALNNQKVLVIDGDMRHGTASSYIDTPTAGLSDYLSGHINNINEVIVPDDEIKDLSILPVGTMPPNPAELLRTPRFGELIAELRHHYDYILIDCPPFELVADAQIIDKAADRTIVVVRAGMFDRAMLPQIDKLYDEDKLKNMAIILNGTTIAHGRYGSSYTYSHGANYGYNYGYHSSDKRLSLKWFKNGK